MLLLCSSIAQKYFFPWAYSYMKCNANIKYFTVGLIPWRVLRTSLNTRRRVENAFDATRKPLPRLSRNWIISITKGKTICWGGRKKYEIASVCSTSTLSSSFVPWLGLALIEKLWKSRGGQRATQKILCGWSSSAAFHYHTKSHVDGS